jgi:glutamate---methylamine ligase
LDDAAAGKTEQLADAAADLGLKYFLISFTDLFGFQRAKLVPASAIAGMQKGGAGFAGFAANFDMTPADADLLAMPDPATLIALPWKPEIGWVASDLRTKGQVFGQSPRDLLRRLRARAAEQGLTMKTGVECEFMMITPDGGAISDSHDQADKPCYDAQALLRRYDVIAEICDAMAALGWSPYQNDHEDANGQFEMNWEYAEALTTADRHAFFKFMVKSIAEKHGLRATFMPKPFLHLTGNGCHTHISLWRGAGCVFDDGADAVGLSRDAYAFMGGLMHSAEALCALFNPTVNSYKRISAPTTTSGASWSPGSVTYAGDNRTHMIRVPAPGRMELRLPDGAANPYLLQAGILAAGLDGLDANRDPGQRLDINMYTDGHGITDARRLPANLLDALRALDASAVLRAALGDAFVDSYLRVKMRDWNEHAGVLTDWERRATLNC